MSNRQKATVITNTFQVTAPKGYECRWYNGQASWVGDKVNSYDILVLTPADESPAPQSIKEGEDVEKLIDYLDKFIDFCNDLKQPDPPYGMETIARLYIEKAGPITIPSSSKQGRLEVIIDGPIPLAENKEGFMAVFEGRKGMVGTGITEQDAFDQLMTSLQVKIIYDNKLNVEPITITPSSKDLVPGSSNESERYCIEYLDWVLRKIKIMPDRPIPAEAADLYQLFLQSKNIDK